MNRLAILFTAFITLHSPSGRNVYVNADEIMVIRTNPGCLPPTTEIIVHDRALCISETPNEVKALVEGAKQ